MSNKQETIDFFEKTLQAAREGRVRLIEMRHLSDSSISDICQIDFKIMKEGPLSGLTSLLKKVDEIDLMESLKIAAQKD